MDRLPRQPWMDAAASARVFDALAAAGHDARFVGGCVRNALLGRPVADIDVATPAAPGEVLAALEAARVRAIPTGVEHGTVTAVVDHVPVEITTLRRDVETDGRRAVVAFSADWREDAARRDFTMNAIYADREGRLFDFFGGVADARVGRVRFVGDPDTRIREDVLRLLRFFRFHAHYGRGGPDAAALDACARLARLLPTLSGERVRTELLKLLDAADPALVWRLMVAQGITDHLLPVPATDVGALAALVTLERAHGAPSPLRRLAALLPDGEPVALAATERLRLSNAEGGALRAMLTPAARLDPGAGLREWRHDLYALGRERFVHLALHQAARRGFDPAPLLAAARDWEEPRLPIGGADAVRLGVAPGPRVGTLLREVEAWWRSQDYRPDRRACLDRLAALAEAAP